MGDFCIVPSSGHTKLYERISSSWKSQSQIEVLTIPKVVEWVGAYLKGNNINNPEFIPSAGELVKFIDRQRKLEGKTAFSELGLPEAVQVPYTLPGQGKHTYTVRGTHIYNEQGEERFKESDPQSKTHRNRILANLAIMQGNAVMVEYRGSDYVVYKNGTIVSASGNTPGHIMNWTANDGNRKTIMNSAAEKFKALSSNASQDNSVNLNSITKQVVENFVKAGIKVHGREGIENFYNIHKSFDGVMQSVEEAKEMQEIKAKAIADGTFMKAPNGKPTNLTERQWLQVRTEAFKKWFGDWERVAPKNIKGNLINQNGEINWDYFEQILDSYHNSQPDSMFAKGRTTLATREEKHFEGEKNTLNHIKFVTQSMLDLFEGKFDVDLPFVSEARASLQNQKDLMVLAAMFHDAAKPYRHGDIHGWESADILRDIVGIDYNNRLAEWAIRHHMAMPFSHKAEFNLSNPEAIEVARNMARDAKRIGIDEQTAINAFVLINAADIINGREITVEDNWAKKAKASGSTKFGNDISVKAVLTVELKEKVDLLKKAFADIKDENLGNPEYNYRNQSRFDYISYPEGGRADGKLPYLSNINNNDVSKVVDENGEPLVVYHFSKDASFTEYKESPNGLHFTADPTGKNIFAPNPNPYTEKQAVFLNIKNPAFSWDEKYWLNKGDWNNKDVIMQPLKVRQQDSRFPKVYYTLGEEQAALEDLKARDSNKDGVIRDDKEDYTDYIVLTPNQIKSATDNNGEFSPFDNDIQRFQTSNGEVYGFVDKAGEMYLDETVVKPEHPIHEYTHLWDRAVARTNPKLWKRGISLMKQTSLWKTVEDDANYGKKWQNIKKNNPSKYDNLIASEVHARLVGTEGEKWLVDRAKELGSDSLISKLQQWLTDFWKALKNTFGAWSDADIATLTLADFNHMTVRDMINGINPNTVKSAMTMQTNAEQAPMSPAREKTLRTLRDYWTWQKQHISFDRAHHKYYIDGKIADYSVTELKDKVYGKVDLQEDFSHSTAIGNSVDALTRDFFTPKSNYATKKYPNLNDARKNAVLSDLKRFKEYLDKEFKNSERKPDYTVITSEMFFAARIKEGKDTKTIAGTPDMVVIDGNGDVWLYDMKVKKNSIEAYNNRRDYTFQLNAYRQLLETAMPELKGRIKGLRLIWFDTSYPTQGREARFVTDANDNVTVTDLTVDNLPLAEYQKWTTPSLKRDVKDSIKPLKNGDDVLSSPSPINNRWREEVIAQRNQTPQAVDTSKVADKSAAFGVVIDPGLKANYEQWQKNNPTGIVAYRVDFNHYNTPAEVKAGHIGNPFSEGSDRGPQTVQQFYDWIVTGNNFGNEKATEEYRKAIVNKILETPNNSPVLYYTELNRPSHATVIGYLINNKYLIENAVTKQQSVQQQASLPGSETKMEIWWGSGEKDPKRQNADLSNFAERPFTVKGTVIGEGTNTDFSFPTVEHAFQAAKVSYANIDNRAEWVEKIRTAKTSAEAKRLGGQIPKLNSKEWDLYSSEIMKDLLRASFKQQPEALQRLLATGNATLTHDNAGARDKWRTEFPKLLMEVREELRNSQPQGQALQTNQQQVSSNRQQSSSVQAPSTSPSQASANREVKRPESPAFESALKEPDERIKNFYSAFTPQQVKDRGAMIADYFSNIIDRYIEEQLQIQASEIAVLEEIINSSDYTEEDKENARTEKAERNRMLELLKDPIKGRQAAVQYMGIGNMVTAVQKRIKSNIRGRNAARDKKWQDVLDYFTELFNAQASMSIEEKEGIRIVDLEEGKVEENTSAEQDNIDENDGNDETGHTTASGNDGWIFKVRYTDPFNSLSKRVKRIMYNVEMDITDDLGNPRKYSMGQIYVSLLSYLSKEMQSPDDFIQVNTSFLNDPSMSIGKDFNRRDINRANYPVGYPTFPVLEKMRSKYPWVGQIIRRLTQDYQSSAYNKDLQYSPTMGAVCSQFYTNFKKAFIPYAKIQTGDNTTGVIPLNYDMEEQSQLDRLKANFNNGFVMTKDSIYNADRTINRNAAKRLVQMIDKADVNVANHSNTLMHKDDRDLPPAKEDVDDMNKFIKDVQYILMSFGIGDSSNDDYIAALLGPSNGEALVNLLHDLREIAQDISELTDSSAKNYNYIVSNVDSTGANRWNTFFQGRGFITDVSYVQSFYDSTVKKTKYSYSADNYLQKTFRQLYEMDDATRRAYMDEHYRKYEWFYDHEAGKWRNKWLEILYEGPKGTYGHIFTGVLPYRNIDNVSTVTKKGIEARNYVDWTPSDIWYVQDRNYGDDSSDFGYYLAPIFADSLMSMTIRGPKLNREDVMNAFVSLVQQEMWRIKYVTEDRAKAVKEGRVNPIANFDLDDEGKGKGKEFCFLPELNRYRFGTGRTFLEEMTEMKKRKASKEEIENAQRQALEDILSQRYSEYLEENSDLIPQDRDMELEYLNMTYANVAIIQATTVDLAYYSSAVDFQKRFKEVYAGGIQLNTNSRYGKKTENVILVEDDVIVSPSYKQIAKVVDVSSNLTNKEKERIKGLFKEVNVADAQAMRAMHSFVSVMDMMGNWDTRKEEALERFANGTWTMEDFDVIYQTIKPFVYAVIEKNSGLVDNEGNPVLGADGKPVSIPVPVQHKNSEICMLMMYDLITRHSGLNNSPVYKGLSKFMASRLDASGRPIIDMIQYESAGKVGNQGVINISYSRKKVAQILRDGIKLNENSKDTLTYEDFDTLYQAEKEKKNKGLPDNASAVLKDAWKKIRKDLDKALDSDAITQERYNELVSELRPDEKEIMEILDTALIKEGDAYIINPEYVQTIPFDNYYQAQPTPEHHIDAEASFGSQARNIVVADLPENLRLVLEGTIKGKKTEQVKEGRDAIIDFMYELLDENLLEDFYGTSTKKGLVDIFKDKNSFRKAIEDVVRGNPKYGQDFADALKLDKNGNFILSPNSPNMFHLMQDIVTSFFKNHITKQKINGAALIQAAGIGLDNDLRVLFDKAGKPIGAECYMPATSRRFFEPFLKKDKDGNMYLDAEGLKNSKLDKAIGYRIPSENKSSMLPLIIKGFTPMQNGSCIVLPAEITTLAGSDFDVDKMFIMLSSFFVSNYRKADARKDFAKSRKLFDWISRIGALGENMQEGDEIDGAEEEAFNKWFEENKESYRRKTPKIIKVEYDFSKSPEENGRKARNNMIIQMMYKILISKEGSESLFNPQGFPDVERTAKMMKVLTDNRLREALYIKFGGDLDKMASFALEGSEKELKKFIDENTLPESPIYPQAFAHAHARNMAGAKQIGIYAVQASMGAKFQRANITIKEHRQIELDGKHTDVDRSDGGRRLKNNGQMVGASADNGKKPNLTDMGSTDDTAAIIGYLLRAGYTHAQAALLIAQPEMQMSGFSTKGFLRRVSPTPKSLPKGQLTSKDLVLNILAGNDAKEDIIKRAVWEVLSQHEAMEYVTQVSRADSPNGAMDNSFAGARLQRYKVDLLQGKMEEKDYPFYMRGALSNDVIDVKQGKAAVREALKKQPLAFLYGMYSLGISSLGDLASPFFYMLSEEFDNKIVKPILYNMPEEMSDATKKKILDRVYTDWITFTLSGSALFGNEDGASASNKRDYYLKEFASDFRKVLQNNPDIRELVGPILEADGNRVVLRNVGTLLKGQKEDVSRRLTSLIYGIDPNNPNKEAQKLAKDLLMFSYYDSGINFRHDSYSSVLSTQFLTLIEAYTEALNKVNSSIEEGMDKRFIDQFMLTNPEAALPTSNMEDKPWFNLGSERIEIDMNISGLPNKWIINPATTRNRRYNGVSPYTYIRTSFGLYKLNEEMFKANGAMAVYDRVPDYGTTSSRPIYSSQETLERLVELYPVGIYDNNSKEDDLTAAYNSITQIAPPPVSRAEAHADPAIQNTNNSSSPVPYNSPSVDNDMYDALSNPSSSDTSAPPFTGKDYDNINSFGEVSHEQLTEGAGEELSSILYTKQGNETIDKPQCTVKKQ